MHRLFPNEPTFGRGFRHALAIYSHRLAVFALVILLNTLLVTAAWLTTVPDQNVRDYVFAVIFVSPLIPLGFFLVQRYVLRVAKPNSGMVARRMTGCLAALVALVVIIMLAPNAWKPDSTDLPAYSEPRILPSPPATTRPESDESWVVSAPRDPPPNAFAADLLARINSERRSRNIPVLTWDGKLGTDASEWSERMASRDRLQHYSDDFVYKIPRWTWYGQNVGYGPSTGLLYEWFLKSPRHRANILYRTANLVGIGTACLDGKVWVTMTFLEDPSIRRGSNRLSSNASSSKDSTLDRIAPLRDDGLRCPVRTKRNAQ
jgi:uncharacterized protein YkwD